MYESVIEEEMGSESLSETKEEQCSQTEQKQNSAGGAQGFEHLPTTPHHTPLPRLQASMSSDQLEKP